MERKEAANKVVDQLLAGNELIQADINHIVEDSHGATQLIGYIRHIMCIDVPCDRNSKPAQWFMTPESIQEYKENPAAHMAKKHAANEKQALKRDKRLIKKIAKLRGVDFIYDQITELFNDKASKVLPS